MWSFVIIFVTVGLIVLAPLHGSAQTPSELEQLKEEMKRLQDRLRKLEQAQPALAPAPAPPAIPVAAQAPPMTPRPGEREIQLDREHPFELLGLAKPEVGGVRISGFFVGSANYNSRIQLVPEFAGNAPVSSEPRSLDFRFDQFTIGAFKTFAPWLSAGASIEVERHGHRHAHGIPFGCPGTGFCIERFGAEEIETEISLHRFNITGVAPIGNGLALSFGRFDTPFGYERHDAALNLTATTSELQRFGRPQSMTGFTAAYAFAPWLDATVWVVNRWENETTEDPLEDDNRDKSFGGRIGFTPLHGEQLLNVGIGGWWGPEQFNKDHVHHERWIVDLDVTWSPTPRLLLTGEFLYGGDSNVSFRRRGVPIAAGAVNNEDVNWFALYALAHYDFTRWLGLSFRYGLFKDDDGARTGVAQTLQSFTITPIVHLSRLIPDLRPLGVAYARTRHPLDWVDVRLEYRLNASNKSVFSDSKPDLAIPSANKTSQEVTLQFVVNY